jgi:hypothetical protein
MVSVGMHALKRLEAAVHPFARSRTALARPHPGIDHAQGLPVGRCCIRRMQIHARLRFIDHQPEPFGFLTVEVQFGRVGNAQHHRVASHPGRRALPMRRHHVGPISDRPDPTLQIPLPPRTPTRRSRVLEIREYTRFRACLQPPATATQFPQFTCPTCFGASL